MVSRPTHLAHFVFFLGSRKLLARIGFIADSSLLPTENVHRTFLGARHRIANTAYSAPQEENPNCTQVRRSWMVRAIRPISRRNLIVVGIVSVIVVVIGLQNPDYASAVSTVTACKSLTAQLSDDKNYYTFTAMATAANGATITGYNFQFGDHQSYSFTFGNVTNRNQATVRHTYDQPGDYLVIAAVVTSANGKTSTASSPSCQTHVAIGLSSAKPLLNVGPGNNFVVFIGATIMGAAAHTFWLRRRSL